EAILLVEARHHVLRRRLAEPRRRDLHQIGKHLDLVVELTVDLVHDLRLEALFDHFTALPSISAPCCNSVRRTAMGSTLPCAANSAAATPAAWPVAKAVPMTRRLAPAFWSAS